MSGRYRHFLSKVGPTIFHGPSDCQLEDIDIQFLTQSVSTIESLILEPERQHAL